MGRALWTPLAESELEDILFYIRMIDQRPEIALRIGQEIRDCVDRQAEEGMPRHSHPLAPSDWRYVRFKRWLIFYRLHDEGIEVMRVVDGARDLPAVLRG